MARNPQARRFGTTSHPPEVRQPPASDKRRSPSPPPLPHLAQEGTRVHATTRCSADSRAGTRLHPGQRADGAFACWDRDSASASVTIRRRQNVALAVQIAGAHSAPGEVWAPGHVPPRSDKSRRPSTRAPCASHPLTPARAKGDTRWLRLCGDNSALQMPALKGISLGGGPGGSAGSNPVAPEA